MHDPSSSSCPATAMAFLRAVAALQRCRVGGTAGCSLRQSGGHKLAHWRGRRPAASIRTSLLVKGKIINSARSISVLSRGWAGKLASLVGCCLARRRDGGGAHCIRCPFCFPQRCPRKGSTRSMGHYWSAQVYVRHERTNERAWCALISPPVQSAHLIQMQQRNDG